MKNKDLTKIKSSSVEALSEEVAKKRIEVVLEYARMKAGKIDNPKKIRSLKLDIARILTIIREKEISMESEAKQSVKGNK